MKTVMNILIGIVLIIVILPLILVYANTHPPRYPLHVPPSVYEADFEEVHATSEDGIDLAGWLIKPPHPHGPAPAIIMCHGVGANKSDFTELAASLARRGYFVLLFDFRAHGESGGSRTSLGYHEQKDVAAALSVLENRPGIDRKRIGIYGFSMGGATAILAAARSGAFSAVVADSSFTSLRDQARASVTGVYHLPSFPFVSLAVLGYELYFQTSVEHVSPLAVIGSLSPVPILIIAGEGDKLIPADNGRVLYAAAREPRELWIIQGSDHGGTLAAAGSEYEKRVGEFFERHMK
jgi:dipeptidyl aminopeptidase/acylaminoacyl peptidase